MATAHPDHWNITYNLHSCLYRPQSKAKKMRLFTVSVLSLLPFLSLASPVAEAVAAPAIVKRSPPPGTVRILGQTLNGNGCPPGSATYTLSPDFSTISVSYNSFSAQWGPGTPNFSQIIRNCVLTLSIQAPPGWRYTISQTIFRGDAYLEKTCVGTLKAQYAFAGIVNSVRPLSHTLVLLSNLYKLLLTHGLRLQRWRPSSEAIQIPPLHTPKLTR
jgi:hypothetical protein